MSAKAYFLSGAQDAHFTVLNAAISAGKTPGVLTEPMLFWDSAELVVTAHTFLFPNGVYCKETESTRFALADWGLGVSAPSWTATLIWQLDTQLSSAPILRLVSGVTPLESVTELQVIAGWVFYPGGNAALSTATLVPASPDRSLLAAFNQLGAQAAVVAPSAIVTTSESARGYSWLRLTNTGLTTQSATFSLVLNNTDELARALRCVYNMIGAGASARLQVETPRGTAAVTSGLLANTTGADVSVWLPLVYQRDLMADWEPVKLIFTVVLPAQATAAFGQVLVSARTVLQPQSDLA